MFQMKIPANPRHIGKRQKAGYQLQSQQQQQQQRYHHGHQMGYDLAQSHEEDSDSTDSEHRFKGTDSEVVSEPRYNLSNVNERPRNRDDSVFLSVTPTHSKQKSNKSHGRKPAVFVHMQ